MAETLPVIVDVTADVPGGIDALDGGVGEVALDKVSGAIDKLKKALAPTMQAPAEGGLVLDNIEIALGVTVGGEVGVFAQGFLRGRSVDHRHICTAGRDPGRLGARATRHRRRWASRGQVLVSRPVLSAALGKGPERPIHAGLSAPVCSRVIPAHSPHTRAGERLPTRL